MVAGFMIPVIISRPSATQLTQSVLTVSQRYRMGTKTAMTLTPTDVRPFAVGIASLRIAKMTIATMMCKYVRFPLLAKVPQLSFSSF